MYSARSGDYISTISPIPNPIVTWLGVGALLLLVWVVGRAAALAARTRRLAPLRGRAVTVSAFVLTGYLSGWVPWLLLSSRPAVFQFYAVVLTPFAALALALVLASFASLPRNEFVLRGAGIWLSSSFEARQGRRVSVAIVLATALLVALLFWPLWIGMPVEGGFSQLHRWLPGW
jgi:dolichyl-phosphate-mannose--protein O-mannosyl transferase